MARRAAPWRTPVYFISLTPSASSACAGAYHVRAPPPLSRPRVPGDAGAGAPIRVAATILARTLLRLSSA
jgi:hypothetical protein